jgi:hypothetical protein
LRCIAAEDPHSNPIFSARGHGHATLEVATRELNITAPELTMLLPVAARRQVPEHPHAVTARTPTGIGLRSN